MGRARASPTLVSQIGIFHIYFFLVYVVQYNLNAGRMRTLSKIFVQLRFFDSQVNSVCFGGDIQARQLERSIGGLQSQSYCVERLSLLNVEAVEIFSC